ncbi:glycosyltransferase involved in cell wall biosynthesis [Clostridium saccharoperbutylacetonicum]|uniref:Glycosyl transferase family 2 n=1 Tax=Clostridium saccharoperbutylacetonicum N1-4(HMT) TaxID=931276 RepID=M1MF24_9CLOT|nr:glycosyltransferase family 2 protein [Clostridium saccharoperbutylacetonicum]AGF54983.1 glycosyl transferase family 2 [Clostridium saccharoperbutylacetonicum N1-4(HMT)]NRT64310.1 glycosyltransferase involved in cell wall biosynthesis [Clostridium saccharoperbutylacetonicum]NSB27679.1 glycosyltransferase involved in cell wall biosynthesis [Clostridium saccharoperbutylacetonicum]NSB41166.1 glycosyltransferase involved in cell wall biosynthesis [Clostridium saccharoperbutylacetonicum]
MISIIIPTFNRANTIERSVLSILDQTYQDFELIIVDDNSQDETEVIVRRMNDKRIKYIKHERNLGANAARNTGVRAAKGELIAFQDSDDKWHNDKLEIQLKALKDYNADIVACSYNRYKNDLVDLMPKESIKDSEIKKKLLYGSFISTQTVLGKKECFYNEEFDETLPRFQDWELMIRLSQKYNIHFINNPLVDVFLQEDSLTKSHQKGLNALRLIKDKHNDLIKLDKYVEYRFYRMLAYESNRSKDFTKNYYFKAWNLRKKEVEILLKGIFLELEKLKFKYIIDSGN